jgi:hypothetical protein
MPTTKKAAKKAAFMKKSFFYDLEFRELLNEVDQLV